ncbi:sugar-transfer associated ATP-grasp domain-containing protein [Winogradskyella ursingii]|uniref:sugar-transfer associated ATP-grasp domain-containing protein n=1 Tax=Winogradskyella ursingii TaxID=2686079 RepID=UPI0015C7B534|nr:sugar-transfer associated ATP-grasp domain-containing protein [Winogradskyella ursingii]
MNTRKQVRESLKKRKIPKLKQDQIKAAKAYYEARGYKLRNTYWHRYYTGVTGVFHEDYVPLDIFRPYIGYKLNEKQQWPALLDKNLTYNLFKEFNQPVRVVQNINGFYYFEDKLVSESIALEACNAADKPLIIKPTLESGKGKMVEIFEINNNQTTLDGLSTLELFKLYKKNFIVQEFVEQSKILKSLNPSSLNTLRIMTYLREDDVHILSSAVRIGEPGSKTDNFSGGGIFCGVNESGKLKAKAHTKSGDIIEKTVSGIFFGEQKIPNYDLVVKMVKSLHVKVPYFRIVSWDIGIDSDDLPIFIEYNTYYQGVEIQIPNGPLFGEFADEILALGRQSH